MSYDVVVVGGGPAGCAVALALHKSLGASSVLLVSDIHGDPRTSFKIGESLPAEAARILHYLHPSLPASLRKHHLPCAGTASAWGSSSLEERPAMLNPFGHGWHLDRAVFDDALRDAVRQEGGEASVVVGRCSAVTKLSGDGNSRWRIDLRKIDGSEAAVGARIQVDCKWLVDATGRKAAVARHLGLSATKRHELLAFYALFSRTSGVLDGDRDKRTIIEAAQCGWWYSALLPSTQRLVAFHTDPTSCPQAAKDARHRTGFVNLVQAHTMQIASILAAHEYDLSPADGPPFPRCTAASAAALPLPEEYWDAHRFFLAVGDAALAFDPLSSQGMMTALEMGCVVGRLLADELKLSEDQSAEETAATAVATQLSAEYRRVWADYEKKSAYYYSVEKRFSDEAFWRSRTTN